VILKNIFKLKQLMLKFPASIKNCRNHYTAHTDRREKSCVWNNNYVLPSWE